MNPNQYPIAQYQELLRSISSALSEFKQQTAGIQGNLKNELQKVEATLQQGRSLAETKPNPNDTGQALTPQKPQAGGNPVKEVEIALQKARQARNAIASASTKKVFAWLIALSGGFCALSSACGALGSASDLMTGIQSLLSKQPLPGNLLITFVTGMFNLALACLVPIGTAILFSKLVASNANREKQELVQNLAHLEYWSAKQANSLQENAHSQIKSLLANLQEHTQRQLAQINHLESALAPASLDWAAAYWQNYAPQTRTPGVMRLGTFQSSIPGQDITLPSFFSFPDDLNFLIFSTPETQKIISEGIQALLLRSLALLPPGKVRFTLIDPIGLGQNFSSFMHLADYDEALITGKAWSEPAQIEKRLADLTEHIETVIQKYLRNKFQNIDDYNKQAGEIAEPYRVLVICDFPANFSDEASRNLLRIVQNGRRCGVYCVIVVDPNRELPYGFNPQELEANCNIITSENGQFVWEDETFRNYTLVFDTQPEARIANRILSAIGEQAKVASRVELPYEKVFDVFKNQAAKFPSDFAGIRPTFSPSRPSTWWEASSAEELIIPLGRSGAEKVQCLRFGKGTSQHGLVAGKTGSGKSTLFHVIISTLSMMYSPNEVELYLIDFKKGVEFKPFATYRLPHVRVIAIESEREFGLSALQGLDQKLRERGEVFRTAGVDNLSSYRQKTGNLMPRILLLVDEFQEFFSQDDNLAAQAAQILDRLVRQGRAFGLHVLLGSQTLSGAYALARSTMDQMAVRIALQCSESDSRLILSDDNPAARLLSRPGEAIYNSANGMEEGNSNFQVAWFTEEQEISYLDTLRKYAAQKEFKPQSQPIIFEGNAPASIEKNLFLNRLYQSPFWTGEKLKYFTWLGDPAEIKDPVMAVFSRQSGSNLLVVGQKEERAASLLLGLIFSLAPQMIPVQQPRLYFVDFRPPDSPMSGILTKIFAAYSYPVKYIRKREFEQLVGELAQQTQDRVEKDVSTAPAKFLLMFGLQHARDLKTDSLFGGDSGASALSENFTKILREGPEVGIFTSAWCDTYAAFDRQLGRQAMKDFGLRVAFQMSADDSNNILDTIEASKLGLFRALFLDETNGTMHKFSPYNFPNPEWFKWLNTNLQNRLNAIKPQ